MTTMMMMTATALDFGMSKRYVEPLLSWRPLSPRAVAVPKRVATIASASTSRPSGCSVALGPRTGVNVALTRIGRPLRKLKYAIAPPMTAYIAQPLKPQWK